MYASTEYYITEYGGTLISQEELETSLKKAERSIDHLCFGRIKGKGFENLTPYQQSLIKEAVCLQADYIKQYGPMLINPIKSYSAGKTRVEMGNITCGGVETTQEVINLLEDTGLRCRVL